MKERLVTNDLSIKYKGTRKNEFCIRVTHVRCDQRLELHLRTHRLQNIVFIQGIGL